MSNIRAYDESYPPSVWGGGEPVVPTLLSVTPNSGPVGSVVTVTGTNLMSVFAWVFNPGGWNSYPSASTDTEATMTVPGVAIGPATISASYANGMEDANSIPFTVTATGTRSGRKATMSDTPTPEPEPEPDTPPEEEPEA